MLIKYNRTEIGDAIDSLLQLTHEGCGLWRKGEKVGTELFSGSGVAGFELDTELAKNLLLPQLGGLPVHLYPSCGGEIFIGTLPGETETEFPMATESALTPVAIR